MGARCDGDGGGGSFLNAFIVAYDQNSAVSIDPVYEKNCAECLLPLENWTSFLIIFFIIDSMSKSIASDQSVAITCCSLHL